MAGPSKVPTLLVRRAFGWVEEYTLLPEKVRKEASGPVFSGGIVEIPLRFLDSIWVVEKRTVRSRCFFYALAMTGVSAYLAWIILAGSEEDRLMRAGVVLLLWAIVTPFCLWLWWTSRHDAILFPSMHPQFRPFRIHRDSRQELEVMEFADAVRDRIRNQGVSQTEG